eukprot:jgi/Botrbrau1/15427/Bobra.43_2s0053.1
MSGATMSRNCFRSHSISCQCPPWRWQREAKFTSPPCWARRRRAAAGRMVCFGNGSFSLADESLLIFVFSFVCVVSLLSPWPFIFSFLCLVSPFSQWPCGVQAEGWVG